MLYIPLGYKEKQLMPEIIWEDTKTIFMSCMADHNLWVMVKDKGWPVGRCLFR